MDDRFLMETVAMAGKIMLASGAEVYRVEETMKYMLSKSSYPVAEALALGTGLFVTLDDPERDTMTISRRVPSRSNNLNRICAVNEISRKFCSGQMSIEQANEELKAIEKDRVYTSLWQAIGIIGVSAFFAPIFGGGMLDIVAAGMVGVCHAVVDNMIKKIKLNDFITNAFNAFMIAFAATMIHKYILPMCNTDTVIISSIMPLVPGGTFTTSIRDTLNGDYTAGLSRLLEAVVCALAIAAGVGFSFVFWRWLV